MNSNHKLTPRTWENDFGSIVSRPSGQNDPEIKNAALALLSKRARNMDNRRLGQVIKAGKLSDETLKQLIELWIISE